MAKYSEQDLRYAAELRESVHQEALRIIQKTRPEITEVVDHHEVTEYFQESWDYPGKWYTVVAIPYGYKSRKALVNTIVKNTLAEINSDPDKTDSKILTTKPSDYHELFIVEINREKRTFRAVGTDTMGRHIMEYYEDYNSDSKTGSSGKYYFLTEYEYHLYAKKALINGNISEERYNMICGPDNY